MVLHGRVFKIEWTVRFLCLPGEHDLCTFVVIKVETDKYPFLCCHVYSPVVVYYFAWVYA